MRFISFGLMLLIAGMVIAANLARPNPRIGLSSGNSQEDAQKYARKLAWELRDFDRHPDVETAYKLSADLDSMIVPPAAEEVHSALMHWSWNRFTFESAKEQVSEGRDISGSESNDATFPITVANEFCSKYSIECLKDLYPNMYLLEKTLH